MSKTIILHDANKLREHNWRPEECPVIGEITLDDWYFGELIEVDGEYYSSACATADHEHVAVRKIELSAGPEDKDYKDNVICPYCGREDRNSWELGDEDDNHDCGQCGAAFSYQRIVTVEYCSQPVRPPQPIKGKWRRRNE